MRMKIRAGVLVLAVASLASCKADREVAPDRSVDSGSRVAAERPADGEWFVDQAEQTGLTFVHFNGMSGQFYYAEIIAPGAALFDYDNDGDLDVYLVQGSELRAQGSGLRAPGSGNPRSLGGRLFRNDLVVATDGNRTLHFTDVTETSGIKAVGYGMGVAAGDFNNDGCTDLYLTNFGANQMLRNRCDGTFTDVSRASGASDSPPTRRAEAAESWAVSATFVDYDRDGWLDLFVGNYLTYRIEASTPCFSASGRRDYCSPDVYRPQPSHLYHNNRNGTFTDVTVASGMAGDFGPALGVVSADVNADGWSDLYVANDGQPNQLWINQRDGTFKNTGLLSGAALNPHGKAKAGMGVDAGDFDNDGDEDLFVTNLKGEGNDLYVNDGSGLFEAQSERSGLGPGSLAYTGFGTAWLDFDNDGWLDLLTVNGAVQTIEAQRVANDPFPLHQTKLLFRNLGTGRFEDVTSRAGAVFRRSEVSRGAVFGDVDNDGDVDVLVANNNSAVRLLINGTGHRNHWIGLRLVGRDVTRDMLGARVGVVPQGRSILWRRARADGSYASANDPRVLVGLGQSYKVERVQVVWPDGMTEEWSDVAVDRYTTLGEGSSK
jgi:enediyne biosynthesis protein E4